MHAPAISDASGAWTSKTTHVVQLLRPMRLNPQDPAEGVGGLDFRHARAIPSAPSEGAFCCGNLLPSLEPTRSCRPFTLTCAIMLVVE